MAWNVLEQLNKNAAAAAVDNTPKASFRTKNISIKKLYSNDKNFYSMAGIEQLARDIYVYGLIENLEVIYDPCDRGEYRITAGERRWRALTFLVSQGHTEFEVATCRIETPASKDEEVLRLIAANAYRNKTITDVLEEERQLKEILQRMKENGQTIKGYTLDSGRLRNVIADMLRMPPTKVGQIESINRHLIPEFVEELKEGRLTFSAAYEISGMDVDTQKGMLERHKENGLTYKEVKSFKEKEKTREDEEAESNEPSGSIAVPDEAKNETKEETGENNQEYEDANPESIVSLCYSCQRYQQCNVKTSTCVQCDFYINKAEAEKTQEQKYEEEQDAIDRKTKEKLREQEDDKKMAVLPSEMEKAGPKIHTIRIAAMYFDDVANGIKTFELRKNDGDYKVGDILELMEFKGGRNTGRSIKVDIVYMLEEYSGLEEDWCILGIQVRPEEKKETEIQGQMELEEYLRTEERTVSESDTEGKEE